MRTRSLLIFFAAVLACRRPKAVEHAQPDDDAAAHPRDDGPRDRFVLIGKDFVDLVDRRVVYTLAEAPLFYLADSREAYALKRSMPGPEDVHWTIVDLVDGKERGSFDLERDPFGISPAVLDEHRLYVATSGILYAVERSTGVRTEIKRMGAQCIDAVARVGGSLWVQMHDSTGPFASIHTFAFVDLDAYDVHQPAATTDYPNQWITTETNAYVLDRRRRGNKPSIGGGGFPSGPIVSKVSALDDRGKLLWTREVEQESPQPMQFGMFEGFQRPTPHHLLTRSARPSDRSYVLALADGSVAGTHRGVIRAISESDAGALEWMLVSTTADDDAVTYDAFDASDVRRWTVTMPCKAPELQAATYGDTLVLAHFMEDGGCVAAIDRATGAERWKLDLPKAHGGRELWPYRSQLRVRGDQVIVVGRNLFSDSVDVLSLSTGVTLFSHDAGPRGAVVE